jgi:thioredoxin 1
MQSPIVEELGKEYEGKAKVGAMEVDEHPKFPQQYGILSIPTLMIFKGGKVVWQGVGLHRKEQIKQALDAQLK